MKYLKLSTSEIENELSFERSQFFGSPCFPENFLEKNKVEDDFFLIQINLSEAFDEILPKKGFIYIFLKIDEMPILPKVFYTDTETDEIYQNINEDFNMEDPSAIYINFDNNSEESVGRIGYVNDDEVELLKIDLSKMPKSFPNFCHENCKIAFRMTKSELVALDFTNVKMHLI